MTRTRATLLAVSAICLLVRGAMGCADDDTGSGVSGADDAGGDTSISAEAGNPETSVTEDAAHDAGPDAAKVCTDEGWCHTTLPVRPEMDAGDGIPVPVTPPDVRDVWVASDHTAWAVTNEGLVLRWTAVSSWLIISDTKTALRSIWGTSSTDVWISGVSGFVAHGSMKGGTMVFERAALASTEDVSQIGGTSATNVWALTAHGVYRHRDEIGDAGAAAFTRISVPNGVQKVGPAMAFGSLWERGSDLWLSDHEFTDCSASPSDICCAYDNACESRFVVSRFLGDLDAGAVDASAEAGTPTSWERIPLDGDRLVALRASTVTTDDVHYLIAQAFPGNAPYLGRVARADAGVIDASAAIDAGTHTWVLEDAPPSGSTPERLWATSSRDVWLVGTPGTVRHWDGTAWRIAHVSITSSPLTNSLHSVSGIVDTAGKHDIWIVGAGIALHWQEAP